MSISATSRRVNWILLHLLQNSSDAEEVLQEVYIQIWRKSHLYTPGLSHAECWIAHLAHNAGIDRIRQRGRRPRSVEYVDIIQSDDPGPEESAILSSEWRALSPCLAELDPDHESAIRRVYLEGLSYEELAADLEMPMNTLKSWLRRSLLRLKNCMSRVAGQPNA